MRHIKKKFHFEKLLTQQEIDAMNSKPEIIQVAQKAFKAPPNIPKGHTALLLYDSNICVTAFRQKIDGINYFLPEPDPVLIYFNNAWGYYKGLLEERKKLVEVIDTDKVTESIINRMYNYFGLSNSYIINLFTSIEAFINREIPENFVYVKEKHKHTEVYNKSQIIDHLPVGEKIQILPLALEVGDFMKKHPTKKPYIDNLKDFRNRIVHPKADSEGDTPYNHVYSRAITFKYLETLEAVKDFLNYYKPGYIVDCDCGEDL